MSQDAEKEASEVLHSLLSIERVKNAKGGNQHPIKDEDYDDSEIIVEEHIEDDEYIIEYDVQDRQMDAVDVVTPDQPLIRMVPQPPKIKRRKKKIKPVQPINPKMRDLKAEESSDNDEDSPQFVLATLKKGCGCSLLCYRNLNPEEVYRHRLNIAELTKNEHDMYLMGVTMGCMANSKITSRQKERQRQRATYVYQGKRVCIDAFIFLENVTLYHIKRIRNHVLQHGVTPRMHGNLGKKPHNTFSLEMYKNVENYVREFLRTIECTRSGIIQGITRLDIYESYKNYGRMPNDKLMGYSTFRHFMNKQFPHVKFQKMESPFRKRPIEKTETDVTFQVTKREGGGVGNETETVEVITSDGIKHMPKKKFKKHKNNVVITPQIDDKNDITTFEVGEMASEITIDDDGQEVQAYIFTTIVEDVIEQTDSKQD